MRIAVCDDEVRIRECMERYVKLMYSDFDVVTFTSAEELLDYGDEIDIIFLDIQFTANAAGSDLQNSSVSKEPLELSYSTAAGSDLHTSSVLKAPVEQSYSSAKSPGMTGMDAARELRKRGSDVTIIFVTGAEEYVFEAFDVGAFHYLVKPFDTVKFYEVLKKAIAGREIVNIRKNTKEEPGIVVKRGATTSKIYLHDICYIEVFNRKLLIHKRNDDVEIYGTLSDFEDMLSDDFVRCHRSNIVNLRYVQDYDKNTVCLENGARVLMSKQKYPGFVKRYMQWVQDIQSKI